VHGNSSQPDNNAEGTPEKYGEQNIILGHENVLLSLKPL